MPCKTPSNDQMEQLKKENYLLSIVNSSFTTYPALSGLDDSGSVEATLYRQKPILRLLGLEGCFHHVK